MEEALELIDELIEDYECKANIDMDITVKSPEKAYLYALQDVRDEILVRITAKKIYNSRCKV